MGDKPKKKNFVKFLFGIAAAILISIVSFFVYSYFQGSEGNYTPPEPEKQTHEAQIAGDLTSLSNALESYYAINLSYPDSLRELVPDFIDSLPVEPLSHENYLYFASADSGYQIEVRNPNLYKLNKYGIKNGKIIKN